MKELELMDRRVLERNMRKGKVTQKDLDGYLAGLADREENAQAVEYDEELLKANSREGRAMRGSREQDDFVD